MWMIVSTLALFEVTHGIYTRRQNCVSRHVAHLPLRAPSGTSMRNCIFLFDHGFRLYTTMDEA